MVKTAHPAYGVWEVWNGLPPEYDDLTAEEIEEQYDFIGTFKGFVDDIAFHLVDKYQDRYPFTFCSVTSDTPCVAIDFTSFPAKRGYCEIHIQAPSISPGICRPEVVSADVTRFFKGRPVTFDVLSDVMGYTRSIRLSQHLSAEGKQHAQRKASLELILGKLTKGEIQTLVEHGLTQYTY